MVGIRVGPRVFGKKPLAPDHVQQLGFVLLIEQENLLQRAKNDNKL